MSRVNVLKERRSETERFVLRKIGWEGRINKKSNRIFLHKFYVK